MGVERSTLFFDIFARYRGNGLKAFARDADNAEDAADRLNDANTKLADTTAKQFQGLKASKRDIDAVGLALRKMQAGVVDIRRGGGVAPAFDGIRASKRDLDSVGLALRKIRANVVALSDAPDRNTLSLGTRIGAGITRGIGNALIDASGMIGRFLTHLPPQAQAGIAAAAAAAAAGVGAAINGVLLGALSSGVVAAGVALAARDTRVKQAGADLGRTLLDGLTDAADGFVEPTLRSIGIIRGEFAGMSGDLRKLFNGAAGFVEPLTRGLTGLVREMLPGLNTAISKSTPVVDAVSDSFVQLGESVGDAFAIMSMGSDGAAQGLRDLVSIADFGLRNIATSMLVMSKTWEYAGAGISPAVATLTAVLGESGNTALWVEPRYNSLAAAYARSGMAAARSQAEIDGMRQAVAEAAGELISAEQAQIRLEQTIDDSTEAIHRNAGATDINKTKQRENRAALIDIAAAARNAADAVLTQTGSQDAANAVLDRGREAFLAAARAAGVNATAAQNLANKLFGIPGRRQTDLVVNKAAAEKALGQFNTSANWATRDREMRILVTYNRPDQSGALGAVGQLGYRASGGPVRKNHAYVVGERGPEVLVPDQSGTVIPSIDKFRTMAGWSGTTGGQPIVIQGDVVLQSIQDPAALVKALQRYVKDNGPIRGVSFG